MKDDKTKYRCIVFSKKLPLSTSGRCVLTEHARGNKHIKNVTKRDNFFKPLIKHNEKCSLKKGVFFKTFDQSQKGNQFLQNKLLISIHFPKIHRSVLRKITIDLL